ncbi:hypothetical protein TELCIR_03276 [Teladorsagia circumcincta]|uniref:AMP-binding enzyme C-terminal domain-containing protein n=1 Tax=Teladorsagia circumcincta TaxID=45464 RepID=A0A2G9UWZ5_TELCI|nr:hypothetical protein TELCIR_03276 [Teladorsagia circumcincta]
MENVWGFMVRKVYAQNKRFRGIKKLKKAIVDGWPKLTPSHLFASIRRSSAWECWEAGWRYEGLFTRISNLLLNLELVRINEAGGIEIQGSSLFAGYWKNPTKTAQEFTADKYFITGDLGAVDEDGFLHILGRGKDLIITGGFNVYAKEIEDRIDRLPNISESAIIGTYFLLLAILELAITSVPAGVPHKDLGEVVVAVVKVNSSKPINEEEKEREIISALKDVLVKYKVPRRVVFVPSLPRNSMAKVQKKELREMYKHICDSY